MKKFVIISLISLVFVVIAIGCATADNMESNTPSPYEIICTPSPVMVVDCMPTQVPHFESDEPTEVPAVVTPIATPSIEDDDWEMAEPAWDDNPMDTSVFYYDEVDAFLMGFDLGFINRDEDRRVAWSNLKGGYYIETLNHIFFTLDEEKYTKQVHDDVMELVAWARILERGVKSSAVCDKVKELDYKLSRVLYQNGIRYGEYYHQGF